MAFFNLEIYTYQPISILVYSVQWVVHLFRANYVIRKKFNKKKKFFYVFFF